MNAAERQERSVYPTAVIPRRTRPLTEAEQRTRLNAQRAAVLKRINHAIEQQRYFALLNPDEVRAWKTHERSLRIDLEMIDGDLKWWNLTQDERYAELRAQMRFEDQNCIGASNGAVDWEAL